MPTPTRLSDADDLVSRLIHVVAENDLDCPCRTTLEEALDRFAALECRRQRRRALAEAREQRDLIIARLAFLAEIDEITEQEPDLTAFAEIAQSLDEISIAAGAGARAIRGTLLTHAGGQDSPRT
jgi:hypothetical protein